MPISPSFNCGHSGVSGCPARRVKIEGMKTSVMKFRLCHAPFGFSPTFVAAFSGPAFDFVSAVELLRMTVLVLRRKGFGTAEIVDIAPGDAKVS